MSRIAIVDCNNFYASCERLFDPALAGRAVVVLSNNDGCVVSRSAEARALGVPMGASWGPIRREAEALGVVARSGNHALYGDLSARLMALLARAAPVAEVYSVDECFLDWTGLPASGLAARAEALRAGIARQLGLTVSVGIAETRTLAKLANRWAKTAPGLNGVCDLAALPGARRQAYLAACPAREVWGVGRRLAKRLAAQGIATAAALAAAEPEAVRRRYGVTLMRTVLELRGTPCTPLRTALPPRHHYTFTRSFGTPVWQEAELASAVSAFAASVAFKLRRGRALASRVAVFVQTNANRPLEPQYRGAREIRLARPTADTREIAAAARAALAALYRGGFAYARAGVVLSELCSARHAARPLFADPEAGARSERLMAVLDGVNAAFGEGTLRFAGSGGPCPRWAGRRAARSPRYTTRWSELPIVRAGAQAPGRRS